MAKQRFKWAERLKIARGGLTQMKVARALGISQAVVSKIEFGVREATVSELKKFAKLYKKPLLFFFAEEKEDIEVFLASFFKRTADDLDIEQVFLYGSFSRGEPKSSSDVDIGILFGRKQVNANKIFDIISDLSLELTYELKREVNIIAIRKDKWKPMLYYNIIVLGKTVFVKDKNKYQALKMEAVRQMEDFVVMGLAWQAIAARVNLRRMKNG